MNTDKSLNPEDYESGQSNYPVVTPVKSNGVVYNPTNQLSRDELVEKFYKTREPAPVIDVAKIDRIQRMGRINQIGQGVKVLGDIFGSALGANTQRRQPDNTAPALYNSYQNMLDRYEGQKEAFNYRDFQAKRDNLRFGIGQANQDASNKLANRRQTEIERGNKIKSAQDYTKWEADQKNKKIDQDETAKYHRAMENRPTGGSSKSNLPVKIQTAKQTYTLSPEQASFYRSEVISNSNLLKEKYNNWFTNQPVKNKYGVATGEWETKLDPRIKDDQLIRAYLEMKEQEKDGVNNPSKQNPGQYQKEVGAEQEAYIKSEMNRTKTQEPVKKDWSKYARPKISTTPVEKTKTDPLRLGISNTQPTKQKTDLSKSSRSNIDYSKLNYGDSEVPQAKTKSNPYNF